MSATKAGKKLPLIVLSYESYHTNEPYNKVLENN